MQHEQRQQNQWQGRLAALDRQQDLTSTSYYAPPPQQWLLSQPAGGVAQVPLEGRPHMPSLTVGPQPLTTAPSPLRAGDLLQPSGGGAVDGAGKAATKTLNTPFPSEHYYANPAQNQMTEEEFSQVFQKRALFRPDATKMDWTPYAPRMCCPSPQNPPSGTAYLSGAASGAGVPSEAPVFQSAQQPGLWQSAPAAAFLSSTGQRVQYNDRGQLLNADRMGGAPIWRFQQGQSENQHAQQQQKPPEQLYGYDQVWPTTRGEERRQQHREIPTTEQQIAAGTLPTKPVYQPDRDQALWFSL